MLVRGDHPREIVDVLLVLDGLDLDALRPDRLLTLDLHLEAFDKAAHPLLVGDHGVANALQISARPLRKGLVKGILVRLRGFLAALEQDLLDL